MNDRIGRWVTLVAWAMLTSACSATLAPTASPVATAAESTPRPSAPQSAVPSATASPAPSASVLRYDLGDGFVAPDGTIYFSNCVVARVIRVNSAGAEELVAGAGPGGFGNGFSGDGGPATQAHMGCPKDPHMDADGNIYVVDHLNNRIRKIDTNGVITTVAGGGDPSNALVNDGDGGPATQAIFHAPSWITFDPAGRLYISDRDGDRVWRLDDDGTIHVVAGSGNNGFGGDGGPAVQASLDDPEGLAVASDGSIYVADDDNARIRRIDPEGVITTIAGNGTSTSTGDGGPALNATLNLPNDLLLDAAGNLYVVESNRIRRIDPNGEISAFAGTGEAGYSGDGGPAIAATFDSPAPFIDAAGTFWIFDFSNNCVRRVDDAGIVSTYWCVATGFVGQ